MTSCCAPPRCAVNTVKVKKPNVLKLCKVGKFCFRKLPPLRYVEPFSIQAIYQPNTVAYPPPKIDVHQPQNVHSSQFRRFYEEGDFPCQRKFSRAINGLYLHWKVPPQALDYSHYLPIMFDGLCEANFPYNDIASSAIHDMLNAASDKVFPIIRQIILPIKRALKTKNLRIIATTCRVIQHLCMCDPAIGCTLVPYYRQFLPPLYMFLGRGQSVAGGCFEYQRFETLGDIIEQTLTILEKTGGPSAFMHIKFAIPTYESCMSQSFMCKEIEKFE